MSRAEITTPEVIADESVVELSLRPQRLAEFIGQQKVKESLRIYIDAALARREPLDHTLFFGPPGLGKTTLAELIARELGVNIRTSSGPALEKPGDLVSTLTNMRRGDILFIDEIHRLRPIIEEFLYPAMEDYKIDIRLSEFIGQQKVKESLRIYIDAALSRGEPLDHTLFFGPPGLGKTTLAELIARELRVNIRTSSGPALEKPGDLVATLTNLRKGDILFIDEIHRLRPIIEEFLYPAMEDYKIPQTPNPKPQTPNPKPL